MSTLVTKKVTTKSIRAARTKKGAIMLECEDVLVGEIDMKFGERLKQAREAAGLNQTELARRSGVTRSAISQLEGSENRHLSMDNLFKVSRVLQVNPEWLATGEGNPRGGFYPLPADDEAQAIALRVDRLNKAQRDALKKLLDTLET